MNIEKYKKDIDKLCEYGDLLYCALVFENNSDEKEKMRKEAPILYEKVDKQVGKFSEKYQIWYSEALECIRQILPSRLDDFMTYYKAASKRKDIDFENYTISDCLQGLRVTFGGDVKVDSSAAVPKFRQQLKIMESLKNKFESSLFDIKHLIQADFFDNELDVSRELLKKGFTRAAGAIAGVVLEGHLNFVCENHAVKISKTKPTISDFNDALKEAKIIDVANWRRIQFLGDIRNKCDHKKKDEPKKEEIEDLIDGINKTMKNIF